MQTKGANYKLVKRGKGKVAKQTVEQSANKKKQSSNQNPKNTYHWETGEARNSRRTSDQQKQ